MGWFVVIATILLLAGLGYYVYQLAERKGWLRTKVPYFTFVRNATGLKVGDRVRLMGFDAGEITEITPQPPEDEYFNVYLQFLVYEPYYGYLWTDSRARIGSADFLGNRFIEVTKGTNGSPTYSLRDVREVSIAEARNLVGGTNQYVFAETIFAPGGSNFLARGSEELSRTNLQGLGAAGLERIQLVNMSSKQMFPPKWMWDSEAGRYKAVPPKNKGFWVVADESPALTERLENVASAVEHALPGFLSLTSKLASVLVRADNIVSNTQTLLANAQPIVTNVAQLTAQLNSGKGALGDLLLPTNINAQLTATLAGANKTLGAAETNLNAISAQLLLTLENLANTTSNLHMQVEANTNLISSLSKAVVDSDELVQGLKRHWLLRSAFKKLEKEKQDAEKKKAAPVRSPKSR